MKTQKNISKKEAQAKLIAQLEEGKKSGEEKGWISSKEVRDHFKARALS
jgi:hypothetical protein